MHRGLMQADALPRALQDALEPKFHLLELTLQLQVT
jgi:hypothetical protein